MAGGKSNNKMSNPEEKLKQLGLWGFCLVSSNGWSVLYLTSSKSRTHYSIALKFSAVHHKWTLIKTVSAFFLIIRRSLEMQHSFEMWLNNNSWRDRFAHFSKTAKMRHHFEDSYNMNILSWKLYRNINFIRLGVRERKNL